MEKEATKQPTEKNNLNLLKKFTCKDKRHKTNYNTCITTELLTITNNSIDTTLTINNSPNEKNVYSLDGSILMNSTVEYGNYKFIEHNLSDTCIVLNQDMIKCMYLALELASNDADNKSIAGVYLTYKNGILDVTSTNSYAMYNNSFEYEYNKEFSFLIPSFILKNIKAELSKFKCKLKICFSDENNGISFNYLNRNIYTIDNKFSFPNYKGIIEDFKKNEYVDFSKIDLTVAHEYSKKNKEKYACKFDFSNNVISTLNFQDNISVTGTYENVIALNIEFLKTLLKVSNKVYINSKNEMIATFNDTEAAFLMPVALRD